MVCSEGLIEESLMKELCAEVWQDEGCGEVPPSVAGWGMINSWKPLSP